MIFRSEYERMHFLTDMTVYPQFPEAQVESVDRHRMNGGKGWEEVGKKLGEDWGKRV